MQPQTSYDYPIELLNFFAESLQKEIRLQAQAQQYIKVRTVF